MAKVRRTWLVFPLLVFGAGCDGFSLVLGCTEEARPGISAALVDAVSGLPVRRGPGMVTAVSPVRADTVRLPEGELSHHPVPLAIEAGGQYRLEARVEGYRPWARDAVEVTSGRCHVRTVEITVWLVPSI
ncbi:MAG TPA: hypothetical protein VK858_17155 [Longimicrobiales bacterium]|nr:hypothetical protein [Longimicrobiales bacterium]